MTMVIWQMFLIKKRNRQIGTIPSDFTRVPSYTLLLLVSNLVSRIMSMLFTDIHFKYFISKINQDTLKLISFEKIIQTYNECFRGNKESSSVMEYCMTFTMSCLANICYKNCWGMSMLPTNSLWQFAAPCGNFDMAICNNICLMEVT